MSDHKAGVLLLVVALFMQIGFNQSSLSKVLVTDLGGSKRLRALSICVSTLILAPWAIFNTFASVIIFTNLRLKNKRICFYIGFFKLKTFGLSDYSAFSSSAWLSSSSNDQLADEKLQNYSWFHYFVPILIMSLFTNVIDFYVESYVTQKTDSNYAGKYGSIFIFTCSVGLSFVWNHPHIVRVTVMDKIKTIIEQEHALSWGVIIAYILYVLGKVFSLPFCLHFA